MKAFTNCIEAKEKALAQAMDMRQQGRFWAAGSHWHDGRGSVSGAMYHGYLQAGECVTNLPYMAQFVHGLSRTTMALIDGFFSTLSLHENKAIHHEWAERVYCAVPVGADLSNVPNIFALHILEHPEWLSSYTEVQSSFLAGMLLEIYRDKVAGNACKERLADIYQRYFYKMHHHQFSGDQPGKIAMYVIRNLVQIDSTDSYGYLVDKVCKGRGITEKKKTADCALELSDVFIDILKGAA